MFRSCESIEQTFADSRQGVVFKLVVERCSKNYSQENLLRNVFNSFGYGLTLLNELSKGKGTSGIWGVWTGSSWLRIGTGDRHM
jgi:hypothetical protein